ncbi:hypothetical protein [uncultured Mediterranean phage]|nr:hypothetical protein [uncultured Mediterranean phage]
MSKVAPATTEMFTVDPQGLRELEEGRAVWRAPLELVSNVFDEARGYGDDDRARPTRCDIVIEPITGSRAHRYMVSDDGAGFRDSRDVYTLFAPTAKRSTVAVAGRFNAGEKQLIAVSKTAVVRTGSTTTTFENDRRTVQKHRTPHTGTSVDCVMRWTVAEAEAVVEAIKRCRPPQGLTVTLNGETLPSVAEAHAVVRVSLPTVLLSEGQMRPTVRKTNVTVLTCPDETEPWLFELGIPVTKIGGEFQYGLDVGQKVPLPQSRDTVAQSWLDKCIGRVIEAALLDGHSILSTEDVGRSYVKAALEHVQAPEAVDKAVDSIHGEGAVRRSSDPVANARAELAGHALVSGRTLGPSFRDALGRSERLPTSKVVYGDPTPDAGSSSSSGGGRDCPRCGGSGVV